MFGFSAQLRTYRHEDEGLSLRPEGRVVLALFMDLTLSSQALG